MAGKIGNTNARAGLRKERLLRQQLQREGYIVVRSAASKGPVDLIAWNNMRILFIQVKSHGGTRPADIQKLKDLKIGRIVQRLIYEYDGGFTDWNITEVT